MINEGKTGKSGGNVNYGTVGYNSMVWYWRCQGTQETCIVIDIYIRIWNGDVRIYFQGVTRYYKVAMKPSWDQQTDLTDWMGTVFL